MRLLLKKRLMRGKSRRAGMTLIEILVAVTILTFAILSVASMISFGMVQLQNIRIQRAAANCARMVIEYLETLPPDVIYALSPQTPIYGDFSSGTGVASLNNFINSGDTSCKNLSDPADTMGKKVKLAYGVCPGCYSYTKTDPVTLVSETYCYYFVKARITYNGLSLGGQRKIDYYKKREENKSNPYCTAPQNPSGCGTGSIPGTLKDCNF